MWVQKRRGIKNRYKIAALLLSIIFLIFLPHTNLLNSVERAFQENTVLENFKESQTTQPPKPKKKDHTLEKNQLISTVQAQLEVNQKFSICIYDINNDELFGINQSEQFHAASVMKLLVATAALEEVEAGKYKLTTPLGNGTYKFQLQQMINQSNNYSWDYFNNLLGFKREQLTADRLGLTGVEIYGNQMTTQGVTELLLKLYKGEILNTEHRDLLFSYMQKTETENRISPSIPDGVTFYHKTGTYNGGIHDAAVVIHPKNPFILVIFTNDLTGLAHETRFKSLQSAASSVYDYFNKI